MRKYLLPPLLLLTAVSFVSAKEIPFSGKKVYDKATDTTIDVDEEGGLMVITNGREHYALVLPFAEKAEFFLNENDYLVFISIEKINISLEQMENDNRDQKAFLEDLERRMKKNAEKSGVENTEILQHKDHSVLKTIVDVFTVTGSDLYNGLKQYNYYTTKTFDNVRYILHFSVITDKTLDPQDEQNYLNFATVGFYVDFNR